MERKTANSEISRRKEEARHAGEGERFDCKAQDAKDESG